MSGSIAPSAKKRIAILASGTGTNAEAVIRHFHRPGSRAEVALVISNKPDAPVLDRARALGVAAAVLLREDFYENGRVLAALQAAKVDAVVLAGFLWLVPMEVLSAFPGRVVNIHPALLPRHGGKGMYGMNVHRAVKESGDTETGITIHLADEEYDRGRVLLQARCPVLPTDTPEQIAQRVRELEHTHFPQAIEAFLTGLG